MKEAAGEIVIFCDAHLLGLKQHHLLSLVLPLIYGSAKAVLGVDIPEKISPSLLNVAPFLILTGQRAYYKADLLPLVNEMEDLGYGVETFLFTKFPRDRTAIILLPGLVHLTKQDTSSGSTPCSTPNTWTDSSRNDYAAGLRALIASSRPGAFTAADLAEYKQAWKNSGDLRLHMPVRILWGKRDAFLSYEMAAASAAYCDQVEVTLFEHATHWVQHEKGGGGDEGVRR